MIHLSHTLNKKWAVMSMAANVMYARMTGWIYLLLAVAGLFDRHLFYVLTLPVLTTLIYLMIGLSSLTAAHKASAIGLMIYNLVLGSALVLWGIAGTMHPEWFVPAPLPLDNALHLLTGVWAFYGLLSVTWKRSRAAKAKQEDAN